MNTIYLIRHGKTAANEAHQYCGSTDLPLSDGGRKELAALRYRLHPERFLTSGMRRANETLQLLFGAVPYTPVSAFREVDFGTFEMKTYEQLKDDPSYRQWISGNNEDNVPPGGESGAQMTARVIAAWGELTADPRDTALVTHGGVIAAIMAYCFPEEGKNRYQWQPAPGHGYTIANGTYEAF